MGLDDFTPAESTEGGTQSAEVAEKIKEAAKKAASGLKRTQKDEKKARKFDDILANFLVDLIKDKNYDFLHKDLFLCLDNKYSSNFLLGVLSLIYIPVSDKIRNLANKEKINFSYISEIEIDFDDNNLDEKLQKRINDWVEDMLDIVSIDYSNIKTKELIKVLKERKYIVELTSKIFVFFFKGLNVNISNIKAESYSNFILGEVEKAILELKIEDV